MKKCYCRRPIFHSLLIFLGNWKHSYLISDYEVLIFSNIQKPTSADGSQMLAKSVDRQWRYPLGSCDSTVKRSSDGNWIEITKIFEYGKQNTGTLFRILEI